MNPAKKILSLLAGKIVFEYWPLRQCLAGCRVNSNLIFPQRRLKIFWWVSLQNKALKLPELGGSFTNHSYEIVKASLIF